MKKIVLNTFFIFCFLVIAYLAYRGVLTEKSIAPLLLPLLLMFGAMNGFEINWKGTSFSFEGFQGSYAHGLRVNAVHFEHNYGENGDFEGLITYDVANKTNIDIVHLLPDSAGWFGHRIAMNLSAQVVEDNQRYYKIKDPKWSVSEETSRAYDGTTRKLTYLYWYPSLSEGLPPRKRLKYRVCISTKGTEAAIFTPTGTFAGMGTSFSTKRLSCELNAPSGYQFDLKSHMVRDQAGREIGKERKRIKPPKLEKDRRRITWLVKNPVPTVHYYVDVCLEKS